MVIGVSLVIVGNIVVIWYLNLTTDFSLLETDQERIVNKTILNKYVAGYDQDLYRLAQANYHKVPTGIFIESYELTSFEASMIGRLWMKYPKFGFQRTSDIVSRRVREGHLTLDEAKQLINEKDEKLDQIAMIDFISFLGYSQKEFWDIVDKLWNKDIFEQRDGKWVLKNPPY